MNQPGQKTPHTFSAQRHLQANGPSFPQLKTGDRFLRPRDHRPLARDLHDVIHGGVNRLRVFQRFAQPDVDDNLLQAGYLHRTVVRKLVDERRRHFFSILFR